MGSIRDFNLILYFDSMQTGRKKQGGKVLKPGVYFLPWGDHLNSGSFVIEEAGSEPD